MEYLNHHVDQAYTPRIHSTQAKMQVARAALKNIPGSEELIQKTFQPKPVPRELPAEKPVNLILHTGFIQH